MTAELVLSVEEAERFKTDTRCPNECGRMAAAQLLGPLWPDASVCVHGWRYTRDDYREPGHRKLAEWVTVVDTPPTKPCPVCSGTGQAYDARVRCSIRCWSCHGNKTHPLVSGDVVTITGPCPECDGKPEGCDCEPTPFDGWCCRCGTLEQGPRERVQLGVGTITNIEPDYSDCVQTAVDAYEGDVRCRVTLADVEQVTP